MPPEYFAVDYAINPWMDPAAPVDTTSPCGSGSRSATPTPAWATPSHDRPDARPARHGLRGQRRAPCVDGIVLGARFRYPSASAEGPPTWTGSARNGFSQSSSRAVTNEGEGDICFAGRAILRRHGFRTDLAAHDECASCSAGR